MVRILILAAFAWLVLAAAAQPGHHGNNSAAPHQGQHAGPAYAPYPDLNSNACYQARDHDQADLCAQWRAAMAAEKAAEASESANRWAMWGTFLSAIALAALLITLYQTERSLKIARQSMDGQLRPWIDVTMEAEGVALSGDRATVSFTLILKNIGHSPARNVRIEIDPFGPLAPSQGLVRDEEFARWLQGRFRGAILPEREYSVRENLSFQWGEGTDIDPDTGFNPFITVNVTYDLPTGARGQTVRSFRIGRPSRSKLIDLRRICITDRDGKLIVKPFEFGEVK